MVEILNRIAQFQPTPRRFLLALAMGYLVVEIPMLASYRQSSLLSLACAYVSSLAYGLVYFPLGLCRVVLQDIELLQQHWPMFSYFGWSVFLVLMAAGLQHPRRLLFAVLVLLLIINALAYPTTQVANHAKPWFL